MRRYLVVLLASLAIATGAALTSPGPSVAASEWLTCDTCAAAPEVEFKGVSKKIINSSSSIPRRIIQLGVANRTESDGQAASFHGGAVKLPPAKSYLVKLSYELHTWDSYNAIGTPIGGSGGYWDAFFVGVMAKPYWKSAVTDPLTTTQAIRGTALLWGGHSYGEGQLDTVTMSARDSILVRMKGNPSGDNYLNVILDTASEAGSDGRYPSWGTVRIEEIKVGGVNVANPTIALPIKGSGQWAINNGYRGAGDHSADYLGQGGRSARYAMLSLDMRLCAPSGIGSTHCTAWAHTNGQKVYAPVSGTLKLVKSSAPGCTRGLIIDIDGAPGYRVGLWHVDPSDLVISLWNQRGSKKPKVVRGQTYLGKVSSVTGCGDDNHIHMGVYFQPPMGFTDSAAAQLRMAVPFARKFQIAGNCNLPDLGVVDAYDGLLVPCKASAVQPAAKPSRTTRRR